INITSSSGSTTGCWFWSPSQFPSIRLYPELFLSSLLFPFFSNPVLHPVATSSLVFLSCSHLLYHYALVFLAFFHLLFFQRVPYILICDLMYLGILPDPPLQFDLILHVLFSKTDPYIRLMIFLSDILNAFSSSLFSTHVSEEYVTTGLFKVLYTFILVLVRSLDFIKLRFAKYALFPVNILWFISSNITVSDFVVISWGFWVFEVLPNYII
ncbi:hypothetical protein C0J52_16714, partial [Blattella germanica]